MKRELFVFLAMCAFAAAFVPKQRHAVENNSGSAEPVTTTAPESTTTTIICDPQTICAWTVYKPPSKYVESTIANNYCICDSNLICKIVEDDPLSSTFIHRCRLSSGKDATTELSGR